MAFDFPASPTVGQIFTPSGGPTWVWDGTVWKSQSPDMGHNDIKTTVFLAGGTFTPDPNMVSAEVWCWGGGGAGGGHGVTTTTCSVGAGGQCGAFAYSKLTKAEIGASQVVTIGPGGTGVAAAAGNSGGNTSFGALVVAAGGPGGSFGTTGTPGTPVRGGQQAIVQSSAGQIRGWSIRGDGGIAIRDNAATAGWITYGGDGAATIWGGAGAGYVAVGVVGSSGGFANANTGSGGGGAACGNNNAGGRAGGTGGSGLCIVKEYVSL